MLASLQIKQEQKDARKTAKMFQADADKISLEVLLSAAASKFDADLLVGVRTAGEPHARVTLDGSCRTLTCVRKGYNHLRRPCPQI